MSEWDRIKAVFALVSDAPAGERAAVLERECGGDVQLRREVESLLVAQGGLQTGDGARAAANICATTVESALREGPGTKIGPYKLLQQIGEGGFGIVFMAEQEKPVSRKVALKIIKLGMDTRQVVARFEQERQALAMMDHPNIAKVLDAGATETGRPFFVMELVKGDPIASYCDTNNLSVEERLHLFEQVCNAVQHAHQKGIIHRDIKPSNVLITVADGRPIPKVIDFGIAKATLSKLTEKTLFTEHRALIGTPEYMSPEQAEMSGVDIDTRSDIYSLGVLLYELLTGVLPFDSARLRSAAFGEIQRIIREEDPPNPSTRLSTLETVASVAAHRHTEPGRLSRQIKGDLDWIVMKALEKDRTRRYETANSLAADVQRHLSGEPVLAAPPSTAYWVRKMVRRHRGKVAAACLVGAALVLGLAGTTAGMLHARDQSRAAEKARAREEEQRRAAEGEQKKAKEISVFVQSILGAVAPSVALGRDTTMLREMMEAAVNRIESGELREYPEAELHLRTTLGVTFAEIGAIEESEKLLSGALELARQHAADDPEGFAHALAVLAWLRTDYQRKFAEAAPMMEEVVRLRRQGTGGPHQDLPTALANLAVTYRALGRLDESERLLREALDVRRRLGDGDNEGLAANLGNLGITLRHRGDLSGSDEHLRQSVDLYRRTFPFGHPSLASSLMSWSQTVRALGRHQEADSLLAESIEMRRKLFPEGSLELSSSIQEQARVLEGQKRWAEAEQLRRESLEMRRRLIKADDPMLANMMNNLARSLEDRGRAADAEPLYRESLAMKRRLFPAGHLDLALTLDNLATNLRVQGEAEMAEPYSREAADMMVRLGLGETPQAAAIVSNRGLLLEALGRAPEAVALARQAMAISRRAHPPQSEKLSGELARTARVLLDSGGADEAAEADSLMRECLEIRQVAYPDSHPEVWRRFSAARLLGRALVSRSTDTAMPASERIARLREAEPMLLEAHSRLKDDPAVPTPAMLGGDDVKRDALEQIIRLYELWETIEPGKGRAQKAEQFRRDLSGSP